MAAHSFSYLRTLCTSIAAGCLGAAVGIVGCSAASGITPPDASTAVGSGGSDGSGGAGGAGGSGGSGGCAPDCETSSVSSSSLPDPPDDPDTVFFANTLSELFRIDPYKLTIDSVGQFDCIAGGADPVNSKGVWDVAVDGDNKMYGIASSPVGAELVLIDPTNAHCTHVADLPWQHVGYTLAISFVPKGVLHPDKEILVAQGLYQLHSIDVDNPQLNLLHDVSESMYWYTKAGSDLVSVEGAGTFVVAAQQGGQGGYTQYLLKLDVPLGDISVVGPTGTGSTAFFVGAAYWGGTVYSVTRGGEVYSLDTMSGLATLLNIAVPQGTAFWGAGVSTKVPITPPK